MQTNTGKRTAKVRTTLTKRLIEALEPTDTSWIARDDKLAGFGVRVQRNGRKVYVVQSRGPAGLHRVTLGPCAGVAIDKRRREAATIIDRIKRGLDPVPPEPEPEPTVADLAARCMRAYVKVHCKPKTEKLYRTAIDRHIVPALGTMAVKDVRSKDVIALHDRLRNTPSMANHVVAMLSKMFSLAETWDVVPRGRNPCKAVSHYREQPRERFLTPEEGIVTLTAWLRHGRCFSVSGCARYPTVVTAFHRSSSSMPSGSIAVSR